MCVVITFTATMPSYLQKRRRRWYAVLEIPKSLRPQFGKPRFVQSLDTDSLSVAQRRVGPVVAAWRSEIARARDEPFDDAQFFRRALAKAKTDAERSIIMEEIDMAAWQIGAINVEQVGQMPSSDPEAIRFYMRASGKLVEFDAHADEWLASSGSTAKTKDMQRADVSRFAARFPVIQYVSKKDVQRWATGLIHGGLTPKTVQRILSALRSYWRYLQAIEVAPEDALPFDKLELAARRSDVRKGTFQPFEPRDVLRLLDHAMADQDDDLADLIRLGMWTGCRIEELCALSIGEVKGDHFSVKDAKTAAGWRDVPIHRELAPTMARLIGERTEGHVLAGLTANKYGDRSNAVGKRFGHLKTKLEFGPTHVFHSVRKTVVTILENEGIPENVVADIVGHEKPRITYGLYSGGTSISVKREALAKLSYGSP